LRAPRAVRAPPRNSQVARFGFIARSNQSDSRNLRRPDTPMQVLKHAQTESHASDKPTISAAGVSNQSMM
jgi:hypothetical protein